MKPGQAPYTHTHPKLIWGLILSLEIVAIGGLYLLLRNHWPFFLLGPFVIFNFSLYLLPIWLVYKERANEYQGKESQTAKSMLTKYGPTDQSSHAQLLMSTTQRDNILLFTFGKSLWIIVSKDFWAGLSELERQTLLKVIFELYEDQQIQAATLMTSLCTLLPILRPFVKPFSELYFYQMHYSSCWQHLGYKVFYQQQNQNTLTPHHWNYCLLFPALTSYQKESYFSLHTYLRERLIASFSGTEREGLDVIPGQPTEN